MTSIFNKVPAAERRIDVSAMDFGYGETRVFRELTLSVTPQAVTAVVGSNGSGKSTLLNLLAGVIRPDAGILDAGTGDIALVVQRSEVTDTFPITTAEAVMMGRWRRLGLLRRPKSDDRAVVDHWLTELGLDDLRHRTLGQLSGGQRQRVLLAQAFAQESPLLLLDEPTTGLDSDATALVIGHLRRLADAGATVVAATHDAAVVAAAHHHIDLDAAARA
jgi:zinc/manganese transport system ATP-binding protein